MYAKTSLFLSGLDWVLSFLGRAAFRSHVIDYRYVQFESSQKDESRAQSTDSSKAYRKLSAINCSFHFCIFFLNPKWAEKFESPNLEKI